MSAEVIIEGDKEWIDNLKKLGRAVGGKQGLEATYKGVGLVLARIFDNIFKEDGRRFGTWKNPRPWTVVLRAKGKHGKYSTLKELEKAEVPALRDTGIGRMTFAALGKTAGSIFKSTSESVTVGSQKNYMMKQNEAHSTTFKFGKQQQARLKSNFTEAFPGSPPARTPKTGRKSRAKKRWNKEFFKLQGGMKKADGKSYSVKARQMQPQTTDITSAENTMIDKAFEHGITEVMKKFRVL